MQKIELFSVGLKIICPTCRASQILEIYDVPNLNGRGVGFKCKCNQEVVVFEDSGNFVLYKEVNGEYYQVW